MNTLFHTRAKGKLLLSGEYFVLDGAWALALPVRYGQTLRVHPSESGQAPMLHWISRDEQGQPWFEAWYRLPDLSCLEASDAKISDTLRALLLACRRQNPTFLMDGHSLRVETQNDFPRAWGLGTSSTLIAALGQWAGVDPYAVLFDTLGGSGYDLACAYAEGPILYRLQDGHPEVRPVIFHPPFADQLYFVYLSQKQDSREGIRRFREKAQGQALWVEQVSDLTLQMLAAHTLPEFEQVLGRHETLISRALELPTVKTRLFPDCPGEIKSLGAWGGDFVLATAWASEAEFRQYFSGKGFPLVVSFGDMLGP